VGLKRSAPFRRGLLNFFSFLTNIIKVYLVINHHEFNELVEKQSSDSTDNLDSPLKRRELDVEESPNGQCSTQVGLHDVIDEVAKKSKKTKVNWLWKIRRQLVSLHEVNSKQSPLSNLFLKFMLQNIPV